MYARGPGRQLMYKILHHLGYEVLRMQNSVRQRQRVSTGLKENTYKKLHKDHKDG